jgi:hypothetical protein
MNHHFNLRCTIPALGVLLLLPMLAVPAAEARVDCASTRNLRDVNGDGFDDAAVGDPYATVGGLAEAGTVTILFGDADCRIGEGTRRTLTQADLGVTPEAGDHFGWAVDLRIAEQGNNRAGLSIGSPGEDVDGHPNAGLGHLVFIDGVDTVRAFNVDQGDLGGAVENGDQLGFSTAISWVTQEDPFRIAFGAPYEDAGAVAKVGAVNEFNFDQEPQSEGELRQGRAPVPGSPQAGDRFGSAIAYGRLDIGRGLEPEGAYQALIVGAPGDVVAGRDNAGSVTFVHEDHSMARQFTQNSAGIAGVAEGGDGFGSSVAVSNLDGVNGDLVAIGAPGENVGSVTDAGAVAVLRNSNHKMVHRITLTQATAKVAGTVEAGDRFGQAVAFRDGKELAIGVPNEDVGTVVDAGRAQIVRIGTSNISAPYASITENSPGTPGAVAANSRFGTSLSGLHGAHELAFAISSPFQDGGSVYVHSSTFAPLSWKPGTGGITGTGVRFGQSVG